jgi:phospholipase/carboxylesterase
MKTQDLTITSKDKSQAVIIWLHGLGANGKDLASILPYLSLNKADNITHIFPNAPTQAVTINAGMAMPSWYDIIAISTTRDINPQQFSQSVTRIQDLISTQINNGIKSENIFLIGFSQGGAVAYHSGLTYNKPLGAVLALSTYIAEDLVINPANAKLPIHIFHGTSDDVVPIDLAHSARATLEQHQIKPSFTSYPMAHEICPPQINDMAKLINQHLS